VAQAVLSVSGPALLDAVFGSNHAKVRHAALTVMARAYKHRTDLAMPFEEALQRHFPRCATEVFQVSGETPSGLPSIAIRAFSRLTPAQANQVAGILLPAFESEYFPLTGLEVALRRTALESAQHKADKRSASLDDKAAFAHAISSLGEALRRDGQAGEAFKFVERAHELYIGLVGLKPERFEPFWASSLNNYGVHLSEAGRTDEALRITKQALDIRRRLAQDKPAYFEPAWATSLSNYANHLSEAGHTHEALGIAKQALDIRQRLAQAKPEHFDPEWAMALNNYAGRLSEVGRTDDALGIAKQALDIRQRLAQDKPERFEQYWAKSLSNYANCLSDAGRTDGALDIAKQALDIHQRLAQDKPARFEPDWAASLNNYANHLSEAGRTDEALGIAKQALDIHQRLAQDMPARFEPDWATSLSNYASHLGDAGRTDEALDGAKRALLIHERLAVGKSERYGANARLCAIWVSFLHWLSASPHRAQSPCPHPGEINPHSVQHVAFAQSALLAVVAVDAVVRSTATREAIEAWQQMYPGQREREAGMFVLVTTMAAAESAPGSEPPDLHKQHVARYCDARKGRLPEWLVTACTRLGLPCAKWHAPALP